jgi:hypothetical protein
MTPSGARVRGVLNDAISIYFADAMLASAFVARWCASAKGRDGRRHLPSARGRADTTDRGGATSDAVRASAI